MNILTILIWYIYLSFTDWFIHKHILHANNPQSLRSGPWREVHREHHQHHDKGLTFDIYEATVIALVSSVPLLVILSGLKLLKLTDIWTGIIIHIVGVYLGVGIHNYAHPRCHGKTGIQWFKLWIPNTLCDTLNRHHLKHHRNPTDYYCTVYLGFDNLLHLF